MLVHGICGHARDFEASLCLCTGVSGAVVAVAVEVVVAVLQYTWRFMGSYKWGYKSPNMGYKNAWLPYL